jgi:uncharacterized membrane protein YhaH (DUF805 family)
MRTFILIFHPSNADVTHVYINKISWEAERMQWYIKAIQNYRNFSGRATRTEYWMFFLFNFIFFVVLTILQIILGIPPVFSILYFLVQLLPSWAVTFRRLHDTGKSAWWLLINLVPYVGTLVILMFTCLKSEGNNRYGYNLYK